MMLKRLTRKTCCEVDIPVLECRGATIKGFSSVSAVAYLMPARSRWIAPTTFNQIKSIVPGIRPSAWHLQESLCCEILSCKWMPVADVVIAALSKLVRYNKPKSSAKNF